MHIRYEPLQIFFVGCIISHILAKLDGHEIQLITQKLVKERIGIFSRAHEFPSRKIESISYGLSFGLREVCFHPAEVITVWLRRADTTSPAADQGQAVADGQVVKSVITISRLEVIVLRCLLQFFLQKRNLPTQIIIFLFLSFFMPINLIANYPPSKQITTTSDTIPYSLFFDDTIFASSYKSLAATLLPATSSCKRLFS